MAGRPTKYAHVTGNLPRAIEQNPQRADILVRVQQEILREVVEGESPYDAQSTSELVTVGTRHFAMALSDLKRAAGGKQHANTLSQAYYDVRILLDELKMLESGAQLLLDAYEELMTRQMEAEGVRSVNFTNGASISTYSEPYASVRDKVAFREWCVANGYEMQLALHPSTTSSVVKERLLAGEPTPDGVEVFAKTMVRVNKA